MKPKKFTSQSGISLVELLISFCLSLLLMSALMTSYLLAKRQYQKAGQTLSTAFELELLSEFLRDRIRAAGFTPCRGVSYLITKDRRPTGGSIKAIDWHSVPVSTIQLSSMNSHISQVWVEPEANQLLLQQGHCFEKGQAVMVADCFHAEVVLVKDCKKSPSAWFLTLEKSLYFTYTIPFYVSEWEEIHFYIAKNKKGQPALWYGSQGEKEELSSQIQGLTIERIHSLLRLDLKLKGGKEIRLETRLRNL